MAIQKYAESIYAGVLGKILGVYLGRPVEGWAYKKIQDTFGEVDYYVHNAVGVPLVVADDDISGTFGFFKTMEDNQFSRNISSKDIGDTWLNYIIEDKTILWWGGLGRSTEHTAYLRLKQGIHSPDSGSIKLNGQTIAEQIGAQIFMDAFAMMSPGDPEQAVALIKKAASVSHDGLAVEAAGFLGAMEALAFDVTSIEELMNSSMKFVRSDYLNKIIGDVRNICAKESDWRKVRAWLDERYGYDKFSGTCHIVPNHVMVLASLILGGDDFQKSIMIASSAGWDTDCNAGNVGCLNGIRLKLKGINAGADFRTPVADLMYVVTSDGGSCVTDAVQQTRKIMQAAAAFKGEEIEINDKRYGFEFKGATQGFAPCPYAEAHYPAIALSNLNETSNENGLSLDCTALAQGITASVSTPVFIDFSLVQKNFSTISSPTLYSSQTVVTNIKAYESENPELTLYALYYDAENQVKKIVSAIHQLNKGVNELSWKIPDTQGMPIFRLGIDLSSRKKFDGRIAILDMDWKGAPEEFAQRGMLMTSIWSLSPYWLHSWVSSAKYFAPDFKYTFCISHPDDNGVVTIGSQEWTDYALTSNLSFSLHKSGGLVARSKGHRRYYAAILEGGTTASIIMRKNEEIIVLGSVPFPYIEDRLYQMKLEITGNQFTLHIDDAAVLKAIDPKNTYDRGSAGFLVEEGTILAENFIVNKL
jgi:ADP-ribosylglycohydrolase